MFSTSNPSTVQRMSWPNTLTKRSQERLQASGQPITAHDTWETSDITFPWLVDSDGLSYCGFRVRLTKFFSFSSIDSFYLPFNI